MRQQNTTIASRVWLLYFKACIEHKVKIAANMLCKHAAESFYFVPMNK